MSQISPEVQAELNANYRNWLRRQTPDTLPKEAINAASGTDEEFERELFAAFLAGEFERVLTESGEYVTLHEVAADGTLVTKWWKP